eukprot:scaffold149104_cov15-Tisochrysis_lutea.AAC.1
MVSSVPRAGGIALSALAGKAIEFMRIRSESVEEAMQPSHENPMTYEISLCGRQLLKQPMQLKTNLCWPLPVAAMIAGHVAAEGRVQKSFTNPILGRLRSLLCVWPCSVSYLGIGIIALLCCISDDRILMLPVFPNFSPFLNSYLAKCLPRRQGFIVDKEDSSLTRSNAYMQELFEKANMQ